MSAILSENRYGKSRVRLVKVERLGSRHEMKDLNVDVQLSGDFSPAYLEGDNRKVLPTDSMKNTVYALAREQPLGEIEEFGQRLAEHFLCRNAHVSLVRIAISQSDWSRIRVNGQEHDHAFVRGADKRPIGEFHQDRPPVRFRPEVPFLMVLKTDK